jgi:GrpB-like predicted nucleotidyltransferase (UPF0157 family)
VRIRIADYDPEWPRHFQSEAEKIRAALGHRVLRIEHAGSTSVPGLPAKPVIDIVLAVADSSQEAEYAAALEHAGYRLTIREPEWYEHRLFQAAPPHVNLHVFSDGCPEIGRMLMFRDWLRIHPADRDLYARGKRALAERDWNSTQEYADAKAVLVQEILSRAQHSQEKDS